MSLGETHNSHQVFLISYLKRYDEQYYGHRSSTYEGDIPENYLSTGFDRRRSTVVQQTVTPSSSSPNHGKSNHRSLLINFLKYSFYFVCACGCFYQIAEVFQLYFMYKTVTDLRIYRPLEIYPPSLSICFPYFQLINLTRAFQLFPALSDYSRQLEASLNISIDYSSHQIMVFKIEENGFDWHLTRHLQQNYTLGEIISMTKTLDDIFMRCVLTDPLEHTIIESSDLDQCYKAWNFDNYVKDELKCFRFSFKPIQSQPNIYNLERLSAKFAWRSLLMQVRLNIDALGRSMERLFLYIHPHYKLPTGRTDSSLEFKHPARHVTFIMTYSRVVGSLLPSPYESNCFNYPVNRGHSVDQCIINRSYTRYGRVPFTLVFPSNSSLKVFGYRAIKDNVTLEKELESLIYQCMLIYDKPDCMLEVYRSEMLSTYEGGRHLKIEVSIPSALDVVNKLEEKQTLLEYLIYNGSVVGFWFGLYITKIFNLLSFIGKLIVKRKRHKVSQNGNQILTTNDSGF